MTDSLFRARQEFLKFLALSPYVAALGGATGVFARTAAAQQSADSHASAASGDVISSPKDALSVFDFDEAARRKVLPGH